MEKTLIFVGQMSQEEQRFWQFRGIMKL